MSDESWSPTSRWRSAQLSFSPIASMVAPPFATLNVIATPQANGEDEAMRESIRRTVDAAEKRRWALM